MFNKGYSLVLLIIILSVAFLFIAGVYYLIAKQNIFVEKDIKQRQTELNTDLLQSSVPSALPQTNASIKVAELVSTEGWKSVSYPNISFEIPQQATIKEGICQENFEKCYLISGHDNALLSPPFISLYIKAYKGGSRRQEANLSGENITETSFGTNKGLVAVNICKIDGCTQLRKIIFVVNNQLIVITDGLYKLSNPLPNGDTATLESLVTNSLISTFR